jgi:hypothetical protein
MQNKKRHTRSLEKSLLSYQEAYSRHKQWLRQIRKVLVTSKDPQDKIFDVMNIVHSIEVEDATETGMQLAQ